VWGCELPARVELLRARFGVDSHIYIQPDPYRLPFEAATFDVVYANQVFEHVQRLEELIAESRRILRPSGVLIACLPLRSTPVELHMFVPFVHWVPAAWRERYLGIWYSVMRPRHRLQYGSPDVMARADARYISTETWYRSRRAVERLLAADFRDVRLDTNRYVASKYAWLSHVPGVAQLVTYAVNACFIATRPRRFST